MFANILDVKIVYDLVTDIYVTVAKVYSLLLEMLNIGTDIETAGPLLNLSRSIYVLACIFILFRVTVSFLNMLIDPDKVSDKQMGATAVLKRVFVSIILLIVFTPGSYVFDLLDRIQDAILIGENSLINNMLEDASFNALSTTTSSSNQTSSGIKTYDCYAYSTHDFEIGSVDFLSGAVLTITGWTFNGISSLFGSDFSVDTSAPFVIRNIYDVKHIVISTDSSQGYPIANAPGWYAKYVGGVSKEHSYTFGTGDKNNFSSSGYNNGFKGCPRSISVKDGVTILSSSTVKDGNFWSNRLNDVTDYELLGNIGNKKSYNSGVYKSETDLWNALAYEYYETRNTANRILTNKQSNLITEKNGELYSIIKNLGLEYSKVNTTGVTEGNLEFSKSILLTFISSSDGVYDEDLDNILYNSSSNDDIWKKINGKNATLSMDKLFALIVGIVVVVYLVILCVDVIVRNLKLFLLRVMAPIPIVSYIDPKDKIFSAWLKMYISTYADLFVKLFAISIVSALLSSVVGSDFGLTGWKKLLYILGLLVFAKAVPAIINKIFGIDVGAGSFKDIGKMMKTAATTGIGTAVGLGAGLGSAALAIGAAAKGKQGAGNIALATGMGLKNAAAGALRGFGGGLKGKVNGGLSAAQANMKNRTAYANGLTASAIASGALLGGVGMDYATMKDREIQEIVDANERYNEFTKNYKSEIENLADATKFMSTLRAAKEQNLLTGKQYEDIRKAYIQDQINGYNDGDTFEGKSFRDYLGLLGDSTSADGKKILKHNDDGSTTTMFDLEQFDFNIDEHSTIEGKAENMSALIDRANSYVKTTSSVQKVAVDENGQAIEITDFASLDTVDRKVKSARTANDTAISIVKNTDKYRSAAAVRDMNKNK